jgi:hypothetical protein
MACFSRKNNNYLLQAHRLAPYSLSSPRYFSFLARLFNTIPGNNICNPKTYKMGNLLYIIAVILIIGWLLGNFAFNAGGFIHVLLVIAVILFLVKLLGGRTSV